MVAAVETMAWSGETPWHGLGTQFEGKLSSPQMLKKAQLDWTVSLRRLLASDSGDEKAAHTLPVKEFFALVRDSDQKVLDVVGSRWQPTQNAEAFEFFQEFVEAGDATLETAGSLSGGRMVWALANLSRDFSIGKDQMKAYVLLALPHEQGKSIRAMLTNVRVVCWNTLNMALRESGADSFRLSHRRVFDKEEQKRAKRVLGIAREQFDEQKEQIELLAKTKIDIEDSLKFLAELIDPSLLRVNISEALVENKVPKNFSQVAAALTQSPGAMLPSAKGTLWGVVNAVTFAVDHTFGKGQDQRLRKAWFGSTAALKQRALQLAVKKARS